MNLAIFDFDGTITDRDSFKDFIIFTHGWGKMLLGILVLSPVLFLYLIRCLSSSRTKEFVITYFYRGWNKERLQQMGETYAQDRLPQIVKQSALDRITWHQSKGDRVVVVSASPEIYLHPWCARQGFELLATRLQFHEEKITGKIDGKNCVKEEKVNRLKEYLDLTSFGHITAYGDSAGDNGLRRIAHEFHYKSFRC